MAKAPKKSCGTCRFYGAPLNANGKTKGAAYRMDYCEHPGTIPTITVPACIKVEIGDRQMMCGSYGTHCAVWEPITIQAVQQQGNPHDPR